MDEFDLWFDRFLARKGTTTYDNYSNKITLATIEKTWCTDIEINYITWFDNDPCIDIRVWEGTKPRKGISMTFEQFVELANTFNEVIDGMRTIMEKKAKTQVKIQEIEQEFKNPSPEYIYTKYGKAIEK